MEFTDEVSVKCLGFQLPGWEAFKIEIQAQFEGEWDVLKVVAAIANETSTSRRRATSVQNFDEMLPTRRKWKLYTEIGPDRGVDDGAFINDKGQCFVAFQSSKALFNDFMQNLNLSEDTLCNNDNQCCTFRGGFVNGWTTQWKDNMISDVKDCVASCTKDPCLVIAGHNQGGSIATVASLQLADYTPSYEVITFGALPPLTVHPDECSPQMDFTAHYRFGKSVYKGSPVGGVSGLVFDKGAFLGPDPIPGRSSYSVGKFFILSTEDTSNVAYAGINTEKVLNPWDHYPAPFGNAFHLWNENHITPGYFQLMKKMKVQNLPVGMDGFSDGMHCGKHSYGPLLCISERCDRATSELHRTCKSKLENDEACNSDLDCLSNRCTAGFNRKCKPRVELGGRCAEDDDCVDGTFCGWVRASRKCKLYEAMEIEPEKNINNDDEEETPTSAAGFNGMMNCIIYLPAIALHYFFL